MICFYLLFSCSLACKSDWDCGENAECIYAGADMFCQCKAGFLGDEYDRCNKGE